MSNGASYSFYVEEVDEDGSTTYRATQSDSYVTWGYGETPWEAIANLCDELEEMDTGE